MNNEFWKRATKAEAELPDSEVMAKWQADNAIRNYLDDTLLDLNDCERSLRLTGANLDASRRMYVDASVEVNKAFDTLRLVLEEIAYQTPYEDGQNARVQLAIGILDRVRRALPEHELNERGVPVVASDIPF